MERKVKSARRSKITSQMAATADAISRNILENRSIAGNIRIEVIGTKAILTGVVESFEQKQQVTFIVKNVEGIEEVENNLRIDWMC